MSRFVTLLSKIVTVLGPKVGIDPSFGNSYTSWGRVGRFDMSHGYVETLYGHELRSCQAL